MKFLLRSFLFLLINVSLFTASISVDELKIIADTGFNVSNHKLEANTYFKLITAFDGGYKFAAKVAFETSINQIQYNYTTHPLGMIYLFFYNANVTARNLLDSHLDLSFWTGTYQYLGSGNWYKGYLYYPQSSDDDYRGFYRLRGTGVSSKFKFWEERFVTTFHLYHNCNFIGTSIDDLKLNFFTFDSDIGLYFDYVHFSIFGGYTKDIIYPNEASELYYGRGKFGFQFWVGSKQVEFFTCVGIPNTDSLLGIIYGSTNFFDILYISGELKFKIFVIENTISFLAKPAIYNEKETLESTNFDLVYQLKAVVPNQPINGGFKFNLKYSLKDPTDQWKIILAPFLTITAAGVIWDFAVQYDFSRIQVANSSGNAMIALDGLKLVIGATSRF